MTDPPKFDSSVGMIDFRDGPPRPDWYWLKKVFASQLQTPPPTLHHYTDSAGVKGILSKPVIWATHAHFLYDSNEGREALKFLSAALVVIRDRYPEGSPPHSVFNNWAQWMSTSRHTFFVACFTECDDDLNQWRSYAGAAPFQLTLRTGELANISNQSPFLFKCVYSKADKKLLTDNVIQAFFMWLSNNSVNEILPLNVYEGTMVAIAVLLSALFKHEKFAAEQEWRLVHSTYPNAPTPLSFRPTRTMLIPFTEIPLGGGDFVPRIGVGPSDRQEENETSINMFLAANMLQSEVWRSKIPFRSL